MISFLLSLSCGLLQALKSPLSLNVAISPWQQYKVANRLQPYFQYRVPYTTKFCKTKIRIYLYWLHIDSSFFRHISDKAPVSVLMLTQGVCWMEN